LLLEGTVRNVDPSKALTGVAEDAVTHAFPELLGDLLRDGPADVVEPEVRDA
jgi:hypothetical protein